MEHKTIDLKLKRIFGGFPEKQISAEDYMMLYTTIYNMCNRKDSRSRDCTQWLYDKYKEAFEEYITSTVLPSLREKHDECMLRELVKRWDNHEAMVRWMSRFFQSLNGFIANRSLPPLKEVGLTCFRLLVYDEFVDNAKDAIIKLIGKDRKGEQIDKSLLKNVIDIYDQMDYYELDFEEPLLEDTSAYYSSKASNWILEDTCPDYMLKSEECLKKERDRVSHYLPSSSVPELVERVQHELLVVFATELLEKENSGCRALLKDDKVEDLSRMYRLYHEIPKGLEPVANVFKQHITAEGTVLVQQAEDAAMNHAGHAVQEQVLIRKITELHDKYMEYVTNCFQNHTLFHKALKEAFEIFCNETVGGSSSSELLATFSSSELLATFCDNILKKGGGDKMGDEAIEETREKEEACSVASF